MSSILQNIRNKYKSKFIKEFIFTIYLSLDHEINARVAETHSILMGNKTNDINVLNSQLKKTSAYNYMMDLSSFDKNVYNVDYNEVLSFFTEFNTMVDGKYKNISNKFNLYKIPNNDNDCKELLKKWTILFKKKSKYFEKKLNKVVLEVITDSKLIESAYIDIDDKILSSNITDKYVLKFDKYLLRESKINDILRQI